MFIEKQNTQNAVSINEIKINCSDGLELSATLYLPRELKAAIMVCPATGIRKRFYHAFAKFLAENGYGVITFENRAIGDSKGDSINGVNASLVNWGSLDMSAVLEELKQRFPNVDYHLVGHSAGGQLIGLMRNAEEIKSVFNFACSSGSIHHARFPFKLYSAFFLYFYIPVSNFLFGHAKMQWIGMGEPLPKLVASEWARWCRGKGYVKVDLDHKIKEHVYNELSFDSIWLHATDDEIANYENVHDMIRVHPNIKAEVVTLHPEKLGYKDIGHMKFFSSKRKQLWQYAIDWLEQH